MPDRPRLNRTTVGALVGLVVGALFAGVLVVVQITNEGPLPKCDERSEAELIATAEAGVAWVDRAQLDNGRFWYEYDRAADEFLPGYHDVRHAGVVLSVFQVAAHSDLDVTNVGDTGLEYILDHLYSDGEATAFGVPQDLHLGGTALAVAALVHRRIATGDTSYDQLLREMGIFMRLTLREDGGMWFGARYRNGAFEPTVGRTSTFYTGEAFWALALLHNEFPGEKWDETAQAVARYIATKRDTEEEIEDPPLADQWSAYGFAEMRDWAELEGENLDYVRSLIDRYNGRLEREIRREAARVGDGTGDPDETAPQARGAAFGTTVEALSALWRLTQVDAGVADLNGEVRDNLVCGAAILVARQYDADRAAQWARPDIVEGAWFREDVTRMDDQQHAMAGVIRAIEALDAPGAAG